MRGKLRLTHLYSGPQRGGRGRYKRKERSRRKRQRHGREGMDVDKSIQRKIFLQNGGDAMEIVAWELVTMVTYGYGNQ